MNDKIVINQQQLKGLLENISGTTFATITTVTNVRTKSKIDSLKYFKSVKLNVALGFDYTNSVNKQREREDSKSDFQAKSRKWGQRLKGTPLILHNNKYYLEAKPQKVIGEIHYFNSRGDTFNKKEILDIIVEKNSCADSQGLDKEISVRDYSLDSISEIKINKKLYKIEN